MNFRFVRNSNVLIILFLVGYILIKHLTCFYCHNTNWKENSGQDEKEQGGYPKYDPRAFENPGFDTMFFVLTK